MEMSEFPRDLRWYLRRMTYLDATDDTNHVTTLIRFSSNFTKLSGSDYCSVSLSVKRESFKCPPVIVP